MKKKKIICESRFFIRQKFVSSKYQALKFTSFILEGVATANFLPDFAQQVCQKDADTPDIYFTLIDAAGIRI